MFHRNLSVLVMVLLAASPVLAEEAETLRLVCRADNPALLAEPLAFSMDLAAKDAMETLSGRQYGVTAARDALSLWDKASGPGQVVFRIDRVSGRFARVDKQIRLEGMCDKAERKF